MSETKLNDRELILAAMKYRDGNDSCNSFYMGSMATAKLYHAVGIKYGGRDSFKETLMKADEETVQRVKALAQPYIDFMLKHPVHICPGCHQITREKPQSLTELRRCIETLRPYTGRPAGSPGSLVRRDQEERNAAYVRAGQIIDAMEKTS